MESNSFLQMFQPETTAAGHVLKRLTVNLYHLQNQCHKLPKSLAGCGLLHDLLIVNTRLLSFPIACLMLP